MSPGVLCFGNCLSEIGREKQVFEFGIGVECFFDAIEEHGPNDAAAAPEHRAVTVIERPFVFGSGCLQLHETLCIAADLRGIESVAYLVDELLAVACVLWRWAFKDFARSYA